MNQDQDQEEAKIKPASKGRPRRRAVEDEHLTPRQYQNMRYYTNRGSIVNKLSRLKKKVNLEIDTTTLTVEEMNTLIKKIRIDIIGNQGSPMTLLYPANDRNLDL